MFINKKTYSVGVFFIGCLVSLVQADSIVGTTPGEFRVNEMGAATYSVPIKVAKGSAGVAPEITLNYSSQGGDGPLGMGWSLSVGGAITRCPKTFAQDNEIGKINFDNNDPFCLNGQRLVLKSGTHGRGGAVYRTEIESFSTVTAWGNATEAGPLGFTVETKSGEVHYYGYVDVVTGNHAINLVDVDGNQGAQEKGQDAFVEPLGYATKSIAKMYLLKAIRDVAGNYIEYEYSETNGNAQIDRVSYTGNINTYSKPYAHVKFYYANKTAPAIRFGFINGTSFVDNKLLSKITSFIDGEEYRTYKFSYSTATYAEDNYTLNSLQECVGVECLPATQFIWEKPIPASQSQQEFCDYEPGMEPICFTQTVTSGFKPFGNQSPKLRSAPSHYYSQVLDMNGDGFSDLVYLESGYWKVAYGPTLYNTRTLTNIGSSNGQYLLNIDYDGDGSRDLLVANSSSAPWYIVSFEKYTTQVQVCEPGGGGGIFEPFGGMLCHYETVQKDLKVASLGITATGYNGKAQVLDINGDGLEDIVYQSGSSIKWYRNTGGAFVYGGSLVTFASSNTSTLLNNKVEKSTANMKNASGVDVNGDGRSDLIIKVTDTVSQCLGWNGQLLFAFTRYECENDLQGTWSSSTTTGWKLYTSTGTALVKTQNLGNYEDIRVADLNGDGLTDVLQYSSSSTWTYRLANGVGFTGSKSLPIGTTTDTYKDNTYFIDLNKDGAADILKATSNTNWAIYISQFKNSEEIQPVYRGSLSKISGATVRFGDADGDGKLDLFQGKDDANGWKISYAPKSGKPDYVIKEIVSGLGAKTKIYYSPMTDNSTYLFKESDDNVNSDTFTPIYGMPLVSKVTSDTSPSTNVAIRYEYGGFLIHRKGRGPLGFEMLKTTDLSSGIVTETVYDQTWPYVGMPLQTKQQTAAGLVLSDSTNTLATLTSVNGSVFPYIKSTREYVWSVDSGNSYTYEISRTNSNFTYDTYGNLTQSVVTVSDHYGNDALTTTTSNIYGYSAWEKRFGRLTKSTVSKSRDGVTQTRVTTYEYFPEYDYQRAGLLKATTVRPEDSDKTLRTEYEYDAFGNKIKETLIGAENYDGSNVQQRTQESYFDNRGRLLDYSIDRAGVRTDYRYNGLYADSVRGRIDSTTSIVNGLSYTTEYNAFGQETRQSAPGTSDVITSRAWCGIGVSCSATESVYQIKTTKAGSPTKLVEFDFLGREVLSKTQNFSGGWTTITRTYDSRGRESIVYEPTNGSSTSYYTQTYYDIYNRVSSVKLPNSATVSTKYFGLLTEKYDARGNVARTWKNPQGEVVKVEDAIGNVIEYSYDPNGNLIKTDLVSRSGVRTTKVTTSFDEYGVKLSTTDQDKGYWQYQYNAFGELVKQTTAKYQNVYLDYDSAGRMVRRYEAEGTSCWVYDDSTGRLLSERRFKNSNLSAAQCASYSTANYQKDYFYDNAGRVDQTDVTIRSTNSYVNGVYVTSTSYDSYGRVYTVTYPNNLTIRNVYNSYGYLRQTLNHSSGRAYQTIDGMNQYGQVTQVTYANGARENIGYFGSDGKVASHRLTVNGSQKHFLNYSYDLNNNVTRRTHSFYDKGYTSWSESLSYDALNRLDYRDITVYDASYLPGNFQSDQNYNYDDWGNITYKTGVGNYYYDGSKKHRLLRTAGSKTYNFTYDANGNITADGTGRSFSYYSFDKVNRITKGSVYSEFEYAPDRARYYRHDRRIESGANADYFTAYVGGYEKIHRTGGGKASLTEHKVNLGNIIITSRSDNTSDEHYLHKDHLGSPISITDKTGAIVQQSVFDPWGEQTRIWQASEFQMMLHMQPTRRGFTGHEHIDGLDIIHMNGRIYDANIGRFMQADPIIQSPGDFQNYNRYSYVRNNPLKYTDPSGYSWFSKTWKKIKKWVKPIVAAIAAYYTFGWALNALGTTVIAPGFSLGGSLGFTATTTTYGIGAYIGAGAAAGFVGGAIMTGSLRGAMQGAASGAIFGGIQGGYGNTWSWGRVGSTSVAGGVSAEIAGGRFKDGFRLALAVSLVRLGWEYTKQVTNGYKLTACNLKRSKCFYNKWGELVTDGGRGYEQIKGTDPGSGNFITNSGMSLEGAGFDPAIPDHSYTENSMLGRYVNAVSKTHDWLNSDLSRVFGFQGYDTTTGMWLQGGSTYNTLFQFYSFAGMLPAAAFTSVAMYQPYTYLVIQERAQ